MSNESYIKASDIHIYLGVNPRTISNRLRDKSIKTVPHPLDKRVKLVLKSDLDALKLNVLDFGKGGGKLPVAEK